MSYSSWEESRGRIEDRFDRIEKSLDRISVNVEKLVWVGLIAFLTLLGHAIVSYLQMHGN